MQIKNHCIKFKSVPEMYDVESKGSKPNTIRILNISEHSDLKHELNGFNLDGMTIEITNSETGESFKRQLLSIVSVSKYFDIPINKHMIVFSWSPNYKYGDKQ